MHRRLFLASLLSLPLLASVPASATDRTKLVFHVNDDDPDHQDAVLRNLRNQLASMGAENVDVIVMLQGGGVCMLLLPGSLDHVKGLRHANADEDFRERIDALRAEGVVFEVSGETLTHHHIDPHRDLYAVQPEQIVPNALAHLADLESRGYSYIKP